MVLVLLARRVVIIVILFHGAIASHGTIDAFYGNDMVTMLRAHGATWHDAIIVDDHPDMFGRGIFATRDILPGEPLAVVPFTAGITLPSALDGSALAGIELTRTPDPADARRLLVAAIAPAVDAGNVTSLPPAVVQRLGIAARLVLELAKGNQSEWAHTYIATLPCARFLHAERQTCAIAPSMWAPAERELAALVVGADTGGDAQTLKDTLDTFVHAARDSFDRFIRALEAIGGPDAPRVATLAHWNWALAIAASRSIDVPVAGGAALSARLSVLAPAVDMFNAPAPGHEANAEIVGEYTGNVLSAAFVGPQGIPTQEDGEPFDPPPNAVSVVATRLIRAGDEIVVNYYHTKLSPMSSYDSFLRYGFANFATSGPGAFSVQLSVHDVLLDVDDGSDDDSEDDDASLRLLRQKTALLDRPDGQRRRMVAITRRGVTDVGSLLVLRVAVATEKELRKHSPAIEDAIADLERAGADVSALHLDYVISHENEQRSVEFLLALVRRKINIGKRNLKIAHKHRKKSKQKKVQAPMTVSVSTMSAEAAVVAFVEHELHVLTKYEQELEAVAQRWESSAYRVMPGQIEEGDVVIER